MNWNCICRAVDFPGGSLLTPQVYGNIKIAKARSTSMGVEYTPDGEEEEPFESLWRKTDGSSGMLAICKEEPLRKGQAKENQAKDLEKVSLTKALEKAKEEGSWLLKTRKRKKRSKKRKKKKTQRRSSREPKSQG